jgi:hypothetical protein
MNHVWASNRPNATFNQKLKVMRFVIIKCEHENGNGCTGVIARGSFREMKKQYNELYQMRKRQLGTFCEKTPEEFLMDGDYSSFYCDFGCSTESYILAKAIE